ncbi:MAG: lipopolysaccharide core heptose(I) kinase RfaP [Gammaproteobacteria bacterium]|nr:lipopolysaccharide core heptose(I) kinase RfaP [Gammaproteobacteria bacterium]
MKFAFCLYKYFPYSGLSRDFLRILVECQRRGHQAEVFVSSWQGSPPVKSTNVTILGEWGENFLPNHVKDRRYYSRLRRQLKARSFDAIIGFNRMPGLDVYYGADFCYIGRVQKANPPISRLTARYRHFCSFEKSVFSSTSKTLILSLSEREKKVYQEYYHTPDSRFLVLPPTLDLDRRPVENHNDARRNIRNEFGITDSALLLLFIGSGFETKGLDRALRALASLEPELQKRSHLMIIGQERPGKFQALSEELGISNKVYFLGGRHDIPELLAAGDLLIHPAYRENTGTILLEAIAAGVPVLTTNVCGYAHHVQQANAGVVLASPFEQDRLNRELESLLASKKRQHWGENGRRYGENEELYRMPVTAVDIIENYSQTKNDLGLASFDHSIRDIRYLDQHLAGGALKGRKFVDIMKAEGELIRTAPEEGRKTSRLELDKKYYYLKTHTGVGWPEIFKNWTYLRLPVLGAKNEWHGVHHLERHGIDTLTISGYGTESGRYAYAHRQSFILTEEINGTISLEELGQEWKKTPPTGKSQIRYKRWLIRKIANCARTMHQSGANHRDFYLAHFLLQRKYAKGEPSIEKSKLYVIDLHRMQIRHRTPMRWKVKDISGLHYSSLELISAGILSRRDIFRFMSTYRHANLRDILKADQTFWARVESRANRLMLAEQRRNLHGSKSGAQTLHKTRIQY